MNNFSILEKKLNLLIMKKFIYLLFVSVFVFTSCNQDEEIIDLSSQDKPNVEKNSTNSYTPRTDTDTGEYHTINISENAVEAHLAHGDAIGNCDDIVTVCKNDETIRVNKYKLEDYEPFTLGDCENGQIPGEEYTYVPDDNFEQELINQGFDNELDNLILTSNIDEIMALDVSLSGINDLTGIEDFNSLTFLKCYDNNLTSLDVKYNSNLTHLYCYRNELISLDLTQNELLKIVLCQGNDLTSLNVNNGTNLILNKVDSRFNNLQFIQVDSPSDANNGIAPYNSWLKDALTTYN